MKFAVVAGVIAAIAAAATYTRTIPRFSQIAPDSTGFHLRGGKVLGTLDPGYHFVAPWDSVVSVKTGLAVDRYRARARLRDGTWWTFDVILVNRWKNTTTESKIRTFVDYYAHHEHSGVPISPLNPDGSPEVAMLSAALDQYVPCILGTATITDIVDANAGVLASLSARLLSALQSQPIYVESVRIVPDTVEHSHSDGWSTRVGTWARVWMRGKRVSGVDACMQFVPGSQTVSALATPKGAVV